MIFNKEGKRQSIEEVYNLLMNYDVISFDIFDTLILRPFTSPNDLFKIIGMKYHISNFNRIRTAASKLAREKVDHGEVTIKDIYKEVNIMTNIDINQGADYEFDVEKHICYANPYTLELFNKLLENGKEVIIITDMYYSKKQIEEILKACNIKGYKELYVSNEYKKSKRNHDLFQVVAPKYKGKKVIHIGDNYSSDIEPLSEIGWDAYFYPKTVTFDNTIIKYKMSYNLRSIFNAIIQNRFHNGLTSIEDNPKYYYGYILGGILALGYTNWIHNIAKNEGYQKILFLSRDGDVLKKVYDSLYNDIPSEYVYWSRHAGIKTAIERDLAYFIFQFINRRLNMTEKTTVEELLKDAELDFLIPYLQEYSIEKTQIINREICDIIIDLVKKNINEVRKMSNKYKEAAKKYFEPILKDCKKVLIADIGWKGSSLTSLKYLIEDVWKMPITVTGTVVGNYAYKKGYDTSMLQCGDMRAYSFSEAKNLEYALIHQKNLEISNSIVETLFTAKHASFLKYTLNEKNEVEPIFATENINSEFVEIIQQGIIDFSKDYTEKTKYFRELMNISGRDAYTPIISLISDNTQLNRFLEVFKDYNFVVTVGGLTQEGKELSTTLPEMVSHIKAKNQLKPVRKVRKKIRKYLSKIKKKLKKIRNKNGK